MAIRKGGPTDMVLQYASQQPGSIISRGEATRAYCLGRVPDSTRPGVLVGGKGHPMAVGNVLRRHFTRVEGAKPQLFVLNSSMAKSHGDELADVAALLEFRMHNSCDEFGMTIPLRKFDRMSDIFGSEDDE